MTCRYERSKAHLRGRALADVVCACSCVACARAVEFAILGEQPPWAQGAAVAERWTLLMEPPQKRASVKAKE